jgi:butyrate kinase
MAYSERLVERLRTLIDWIAPVTVDPGEDQLRALAEGVFRVLKSEEQAKILLAAESTFAPRRERLVVHGPE